MENVYPLSVLIESVPRPNGDRVEVRRVTFPTGTGTGWHRHSGWQTGLLVQGSLTHVTTQETKQVRRGDVLVEEPHIVHEAQNLGAETAELIYLAYVPAGAELATPTDPPAPSNGAA